MSSNNDNFSDNWSRVVHITLQLNARAVFVLFYFFVIQKLSFYKQILFRQISDKMLFLCVVQ